MKPKNFRINGDNLCGPCVVKIEYAGKFITAKFKSQPAGLKSIENAINAHDRGGKNNPEGIYHFFIAHVVANPGKKFKVTTLLETESGYQLLKMEQQLINDNKNNPDYLNSQTQAYIQEFDESTGMYGWLKKQEVLNFKKWLKTSKK